MKAAVIEDIGRVGVDEVEIPVPGVNEVRIAVRLGGICGSDSSMYHGKLSAPLPVIPGHEAVGVVEQIGAGVTLFKVGQRVTIHPNYACGECDLCRRGLPNICRGKIRLGVDTNGVFAEYVVVPEKALYPLPDSLSDAVAVFTEPLAVACHGLKQAPLSPHQSVLVFGAGVLGQLILQLARRECTGITVCDLIESRLQLAHRMGAERIIGDQQELTASQGQYDVIFETSGAPSALEQAIGLAAPGGTIVVLGLPGIDHKVPTVSIVRKQLTIKGSMIYTDEFPECIRLLEQGAIATEPLISSQVSLEELADSLERFNAPERMKTLVKINSD